MAKNLSKNVTPLGIQILLGAIVVFVLIDAVAKFGIFDLTTYINPVLIPLTASLFILAEIGVKQVIKGKQKLDALQSFGLVIAILGLLSVVLSAIGMTFAVLTAIQGILSLGLGLYAVIEIFK